MEILIGIIVALLGGLFHFKNKADKAAVKAKLAKTEGRDEELKLEKGEIEGLIAEIDKNIEKMNKEREEKKNKEDNLTLAERRERIKKGLK